MAEQSSSSGSISATDARKAKAVSELGISGMSCWFILSLVFSICCRGPYLAWPPIWISSSQQHGDHERNGVGYQAISINIMFTKFYQYSVDVQHHVVKNCIFNHHVIFFFNFFSTVAILGCFLKDYPFYYVMLLQKWTVRFSGNLGFLETQVKIKN